MLAHSSKCSLHDCAQLAVQPCIVSFHLLPSRDAMVGHMGGRTSNLSSDLNKINRQLKYGKTLKGHDLKDSKRMQLEKEKEAIVAQMKQANEASRGNEAEQPAAGQLRPSGKSLVAFIKSRCVAASDAMLCWEISVLCSNATSEAAANVAPMLCLFNCIRE